MITLMRHIKSLLDDMNDCPDKNYDIEFRTALNLLNYKINSVIGISDCLNNKKRINDE